MIFEEEKQLISTINKIKFIREKVVWLFEVLIILDLASIIRAAIIMLSKIRVEDIVSIEEKGEIEILIECSCNILIIVKKVKMNSDDIVTHQ